MSLKKFFCHHIWSPIVTGQTLINRCEKCGLESLPANLPEPITQVTPVETKSSDVDSHIEQIAKLREIIQHQADCIDHLHHQIDHVGALVDRTVIPALYNALNASQGNNPVVMNLIQIFETLKLSLKEHA